VTIPRAVVDGVFGPPRSRYGRREVPPGCGCSSERSGTARLVHRGRDEDLPAEGRTIVWVFRWLGHQSPSFTLDVYAHLMDEGTGAALELERVTSGPRSAFRDALGDRVSDKRINGLNGLNGVNG
jgi:hypothetical protein